MLPHSYTATMFWGSDRRQTDPRSPVQPPKENAGLFLLAAVVAIAIWAFQQVRVQDTSSRSSHSAAGRSLAPSEPNRSQVEQSAANVNSSPNRLTGLFSGDDYPADALDANAQGTVRVRLDIDRQGRVSRCSVVESSGHASLDQATCNIIQTRARFAPALDVDGRPSVSTYTQSVKWAIAD